jgi:hypothetical protein
MSFSKFSLLGVLTSVAFLGCTGQPYIPQIDDTEAFSHVKKYEAEYQQIKSNTPNTEMPIKWVQAANKKEHCKLFVGYNPNDDRTLKDGYKIFWDGNCKNGYAYGLGREFEKGFLTNIEAIALYSGEEKEPQYFIEKDNLTNIIIEGDINNRNVVKRTISDDGMNFDIWYQYGLLRKKPTDVGLYINSNPFLDQITYVKEYSNFAYIISDFSNDEFNENNYNYNMIEQKTSQSNGFGFSVGKNNIRYSGEQINGQLIRRIELPQSYLNHVGNIFNEVKNAGQLAIDAQKKALMVKQQYKDRICKDNVKVDFIDNNEYKAICNENEKIAQLKTKIDAKLAQIEQQKQIKRQQQNQQRLIQARETEAAAAQAQVAAQQQANFNQSIQNFNNNMQMQQLNNNLMMNNMMPKRYDVYVH